MTAWLIFVLLALLVSLLAPALLTLRWLRDDLAVDRRDLAERLAGMERSLRHVSDWIARPAPPPPAEPWTGAFLPTDAHAAQIERQVREAEDHAIGSAGPIRFSSTPSSASARSSARVPLTRRPRTSGGA